MLGRFPRNLNTQHAQALPNTFLWRLAHMSEIYNSLKANPLLAMMYLLLWPPFLLLVTYTSHEPVFLGMWSTRLFLVIVLAAALLLLITLFVAWTMFGTAAPRLLERLHSWLRSHRILFSLALLGPVICWLVAVLGVVVIIPSAELESRLSWALLDLGVLVALFDVSVLQSHLDAKPRRLIQLRLCALGFGFMLTVGILEVVGRIVPIAPDDQWTINPPNRECRWENMEFDIEIKTNAQGFRAPRTIPTDHAGKYRVMVIGDSMTFGHGVQYDETYPLIAETILRDEYDLKNVEVINVSRSGAGPGEYLEYVRRLGPQLKPDLIVIGYFTGNDCPVRPPFMKRTQAQLDRLRDDLLHQHRQHLLMKLVTCRLIYHRVFTPLAHWWRGVDARITPGEHDPFFRTPNALGTVIASEFLNPDEKRRLEKMQADGWVDKALQFKVNPWLILSSIRRPEAVIDMMLMRDETRPHMDREWKLCQVILDEILRSAEGCSADVAFLIIPHAYQIDRRAVDQLAAWGCEVSPDMVGNRRQTDLVCEFCDERQVAYADPSDQFLSATTNGTQLFFSIDTHLTPDGQKLLGRLLADRLSRMILRD